MGWKGMSSRLKTKAKKMQAAAKGKAPRLTKKLIGKLSDKQLERLEEIVIDEMTLRRDIGKRGG